MRGLGKKLVALTAVAAMVVTSFTGCAASVENSEVVATIGESKLTAGVANFYTRNYQSSMESMFAMYGMNDSSWKMEVSDGVTYEENVKDGILQTLENYYVLKNHMKDYEVALTDEETAAIEKVADEFIKANKAEVLEKVSGQKENVVEVLSLMTIQKKMYDAIVKDVDTKVEDKDAAQKAAQYVLFATTTQDATTGQTTQLSAEQKAAKNTEAKNFLEKAKENGKLEAYAKEAKLEAKKVTFDKDSTALDEKVIKAADALKLNEFADVIETDAGYYVLQLTSELDREATDAEKENIVTERKNKEYSDVLEKLTKETKIDVDEKVWKKISIYKVKVTAKAEEKEETADKAETSTDEKTE